VLVKFPVDVYLLVLWRSVLQCMIVLVFHMLVGVHAVDLPCCLPPIYLPMRFILSMCIYAYVHDCETLFSSMSFCPCSSTYVHSSQ